MKKFFFLAILAIGLMACEQNAPDIPSKDYSVAKKASKKVISIMGESKSKAESAILKAGFRIMDDDDFAAPKRLLQLNRAPKEDEDVVCYVYNITEEMEDMRDEEVVNALIESKKTAIIFMAAYNNDILWNINGKMIVGAEVDNVNKLYLECSDNLHSNITMLGSWSGVVIDTEDDAETQTEYTDFDLFFKAVAPLNAVTTQESAGCSLDMFGTRGFGYAVSWNKPNESEARYQINNGYKTAIAEAGFSITYIDYANMDF
ncbi:MAG: hypothetical protein IKX20_00700 [Paludibacteraceae bacterium]|nr:hypothetical protein [Paludibacteraceae bacterium]